MAPLYRDLHSGSGTLKQIHAPQWQSFLDSLDSQANVIAQPAGLWLPLGAKITKLGSSKIACKANLPRVPPSPKSHELKPRMHYFGLVQALHMTACAALCQNPMLHCYAAADARADGDVVGIGGWFVSSTHCTWFAEQWNISEIRDLWPALQKPAQRYIACFETLAQLALAMNARKVIRAPQWRFALPSGQAPLTIQPQKQAQIRCGALQSLWGHSSKWRHPGPHGTMWNC